MKAAARDRLLLWSFLERMRRSGWHTNPTATWTVAVDEHLADFPAIVEAAEQDVPGQP